MKQLLLGFSLGVGFSLTVAAAVKVRGRWVASGPPSVLRVNGENVSPNLYVSRLKARSGAAVLAELTQQLLVEQYAKKKGLSLTSSEQATLQQSIGSVSDPDSREALLAEQRSQMLLRRIILAEISESELKRIYALFPEELARYEVSAIVLLTENDAKAVWARLQEKVLSFEQLVATYSIAPANAGRIGFLSLSQLQGRFGAEVAEQFRHATPGTVFEPRYCNQGLVILRLGAVRREFSEVREYVENVFIDARKVALTQDLLRGAQIYSEFFGPYRKDDAQPRSSPSAGAAVTPAPSPLKLPEQGALPGLLPPDRKSGGVPATGLPEPLKQLREISPGLSPPPKSTATSAP